ncbi:MAG: gamma-glutamyltransferase [Bdellovibrionaceae bacterium]|nr:gamma-glutamyltransferase [Pseudobdellovibrionaceae bacterium]
MRLFLLLVFLAYSYAFALPEETRTLMVAAPSRHGIETARQVATRGGNIMDVAIAVELTLAVTSPYFASLGGGGFAMIRMNGTSHALDFREVAPLSAHPDLFKEKPAGASVNGPFAVAIPGVPAGLWALHQKYGKLKWKDLFIEAIQLAENGFPVSGEWADITKQQFKNFNRAGKRYFATNMSYLKPGDLLKQPQLATALKELRDQGLQGFYSGTISEDIIETVNQIGGSLTPEDFRNYHVRWLKPMEAEFKGHTLYMMPPPSSSGIITTALIRLLENPLFKKVTAFSTQDYHLLSEIMKIAYRGRSRLGDPDFYKNPSFHLLSDSYLKPLSQKLSLNKSISIKPLIIKNPTKESSETTNFTVMDKKGNTVVMTITLNGRYGSGVTSNKYGIALNNEMDDFTTVPNAPNMFGLMQGPGNLVAAGKRPLSSMSPTIITKNGETVLAAGGAGGPRIISGVFQTWYRVLNNQLDIDRSIQMPRVHHQFEPDSVYVDTFMSADTQLGLKKLGHTVEPSWEAKINGITRDPATGILSGAFDSRGEGAAGGI